MLQSSPPSSLIAWVTVDHPKLDVVSLVLNAFGLAGALAATALVVGIVTGFALVFWRRRQGPDAIRVQLRHLLKQAPSA